MQITNNAKAFVGAAVLVVGVSLALALSGVLGDDAQNTASGGVVAGDTFTPAPGVSDGVVIPPSDTVGSDDDGASAPPGPTNTPPHGAPITTPIEVPILMYHQVLPELPADEYDAVLTVTDAALDEQLSYLVCAGYTPITVNELFEGFDGAPLPAQPVVLTFDDGWADHYTDAFPILQAHNVHGSFAVVSGFVEAGGPYMTWAQIKEMSDAGMEITSHSVSHIDIGNADDETAWDQIATSKADLEAHTGKPVRYFVYPGGEPFRSSSEERVAQIIQMLADAGYAGALRADEYSMTQDPAKPFALNRVRITGEYDIYAFASAIYGPDPDAVAC